MSIFAFALLTTCAGATCQAGQCEPAVAHALLQSSKSSLQIHRVVGEKTNVDAMYKEVERMASAMLASQLAPSPDEGMAIDLLNETLENITIPAIYAGHDDDQLLMDVAVKSLQKCESNLEADEASAAKLEGKTDDMKAEHYDCRAKENSYLFKEDASLKDLNGFKNSLTEACVYDGSNKTAQCLTGTDPLPTDPEKLGSWIQDMKDWLYKINKSFVNDYERVVDYRTSAATQHKACIKSQAGYESFYCQWFTMASTAVDHHATCWTSSGKSFNATKAAVLDSAEQRKAEFTSTRKIQCLLKALKSGTAQALQAQLDACGGLAVDTSFLNMLNTSMPKKSEPTMPTLRPGDAAWKTDVAEYSLMADFNVTLEKTTACADMKITTTMTTTGGNTSVVTTTKSGSTTMTTTGGNASVVTTTKSWSGWELVGDGQCTGDSEGSWPSSYVSYSYWNVAGEAFKADNVAGCFGMVKDFGYGLGFEVNGGKCSFVYGDTGPAPAAPWSGPYGTNSGPIVGSAGTGSCYLLK